jgi:hypothetical protein
MVKVKDTATFIQRAREIHGDRYDYSRSVWAGSQEPVTITCRKCGPIVLSEAASHYSKRKCGCAKCNHADAMNRRRVHPKKQKIWCKKCGRETYRRSSVCKACTVPAACGCGESVRSRYAIHCSSCYEWGRVLASILSDSRRRERKLTKLQSDEWLRWASTKNAILHNRSRLCLKRNAVLLVSLSDWSEWVDHHKTTRLRGSESAWQKKCRNWQRGLATRSRVERS